MQNKISAFFTKTENREALAGLTFGGLLISGHTLLAIASLYPCYMLYRAHREAHERFLAKLRAELVALL